jgi:hypothetical protein
VSAATRTSAAVVSQLSQEEAGRVSADFDKTLQTRGTDWQSGSPGFGTELPPPPQRLEALGCAAGTPACYREGKWAHHGHCPTHCGGAPGSPSAVSPSAVPPAQTIHGCRRQCGSVLRQLSDLLVLPDMRAVLFCKCRAEEWCDNLDFDIRAYGNEWSVEADARCLCCRGEQPRRCQGGFPCFAGSQERALLAICGLSK